MLTTRRSFIRGLGSSLIAAPALVSASSLMPIRGIIMPVRDTFIIDSFDSLCRFLEIYNGWSHFYPEVSSSGRTGLRS